MIIVIVVRYSENLVYSVRNVVFLVVFVVVWGVIVFIVGIN